MKISNQQPNYNQLTQTNTKVQHNNEYRSEKENIRSDPWVHIWDKYQNSYSPKFRSDITESERKATYDIELGMLQFDGKLQG